MGKALNCTFPIILKHGYGRNYNYNLRKNKINYPDYQKCTNHYDGIIIGGNSLLAHIPSSSCLLITCLIYRVLLPSSVTDCGPLTGTIKNIV